MTWPMNGEPEWGVNHTRESFIPKPFGFSYPPCHTPDQKKTPWGNFLSVFGGGTIILHFCILRFWVWSFVWTLVLSSLIPFAWCFSFTYLFILPYTKRCKGNSVLQIKIPACFMYSGRPFSLPPAIPTLSNWRELPYSPHLTPLKPHQENTTLLLVISQIRLNYLLDDHHFGYATKSLKETLPWDVEEAMRKTAWCIVLPYTKKNPSWRSIPCCVCN